MTDLDERSRAVAALRTYRQAGEARVATRIKLDADHPVKPTSWFCAECGTESDEGPLGAHHPFACDAN